VVESIKHFSQVKVQEDIGHENQKQESNNFEIRAIAFKSGIGLLLYMSRSCCIRFESFIGMCRDGFGWGR